MTIEHKENFLILLPGESSATLKRKVTRILDALGVAHHAVPSQNHDIHELCRSLTHSLQENQQLVDMTKQEIVSLTEEFVQIKEGYSCSFVSHLKCLVAKRRLVVDLVAALQWSMESATVHCGCWIRKGEEGKVEEMISKKGGAQLIASDPPPLSTPPTSFLLSPTTSVF